MKLSSQTCCAGKEELYQQGEHMLQLHDLQSVFCGYVILKYHF